ncbi:hypothetical protein os4_36810 (plasmid) [Comamonadaceae bacterium OS-4]|nr:hypothetical protein os4_36810 [Comamonadaceae bacterium OS-4]
MSEGVSSEITTPDVERTDQQVVDQTNELARKLYEIRGFHVSEGYRFDTATHPHEVDALEGYLAFRLARGIGTELHSARYRGLLPHQPLIYSGRGAALSRNTKRRTLETGERRD